MAKACIFGTPRTIDTGRNIAYHRFEVYYVVIRFLLCCFFNTTCRITHTDNAGNYAPEARAQVFLTRPKKYRMVVFGWVHTTAGKCGRFAYPGCFKYNTLPTTPTDMRRSNWSREENINMVTVLSKTLTVSITPNPYEYIVLFTSPRPSTNRTRHIVSLEASTLSHKKAWNQRVPEKKIPIPHFSSRDLDRSGGGNTKTK